MNRRTETCCGPAGELRLGELAQADIVDGENACHIGEVNSVEVRTLTLFNINSDGGEPEYVKVLESEVGLGVYASRPYPRNSVIGEITGEIIANPYTGTNYTFEASDGFQLEPYEPFRYLNHSCQPNCEFDWIKAPVVDGQPKHEGLFLIAMRRIFAQEQFTIDYRWPASFAIQCQCMEPLCRGWVVDESQLDLLPHPNADWLG